MARSSLEGGLDGRPEPRCVQSGLGRDQRQVDEVLDAGAPDRTHPVDATVGMELLGHVELDRDRWDLGRRDDFWVGLAGDPGAMSIVNFLVQFDA